jgi:glycosyltransferase involved in cell wall biosynthesis
VNVAVSVGGRYHAFELAAELERRGHLDRLLTCYPRAQAHRAGVSPERVRSLIGLELGKRALRATSTALENRCQPLIHGTYDRWAAGHIPPSSDVVVGFSGFARRTFERARRNEQLCVVERGSAHIETQVELLRDGYAELGLRPALPHPRVIAAELAEYALADRIAVPSSFAARSFVERGVPAEKLIVNPYGVDLTAFRPAERPAEDFNVVFCGLASVQKGVHHLLRAFRPLAKSGAKLWLIGRVLPEMRPYLQRYGGAHVVEHGHQPLERVAELLGRAALLALPSLQDGQGLVIPQAMASGLPVLASTHTGGPDLLAPCDGGRLFEPGDVEALREALVWFQEHRDEARAIGWRGARHVARGLSWADYGERAAGAYAALLGEADEQDPCDAAPVAPAARRPLRAAPGASQTRLPRDAAFAPRPFAANRGDRSGLAQRTSD